MNEDYTPAPAALPSGWSGWICVNASAAVPVGQECCPRIKFDCGGEPAEITLCAHTCDWAPPGPDPVVTVSDWTTDLSTGTVHFQLHWSNPDPTSSSHPIAGTMSSQQFGVFQSNYKEIGTFDVPSLAPDSFFDVFYDVALADLPPSAEEVLPGGGPSTAPGVTGAASSLCPPDDHWDGNVDVEWTNGSDSAQVNVHYGTLLVCPGAGASYIHVPFLGCFDDAGNPSGVSWQVSNLCPGFGGVLVNEDYSPAPAILPPNWSGWICVTADPSVAIGTQCCPKVTFICNNQPAEVTLCATACDWSQEEPTPVPQVLDWTTDPATGLVRFQVRWHNPDQTASSQPVSGSMSSQPFGVFQSNFGAIGTFSVPPLAPDSFFDVFFDVALGDLPPQPATILPGGGPAAPGVTGAARDGDCPPDDHWDGNVDVEWAGTGAPAQVNVHYGTLMVCPGAGASYIHVPFLGCVDPNGVAWQITNLCPGWSATLVNEDTTTAAPAALPPEWSGWICVTADASVAVGTECCPIVTFTCGGVPAEIRLCATACDWNPQAPPPVVTVPDWTTDPATGTVHFTLHWENPDPVSSSHPISGTMSSQPFGAFQPDFGPIGTFNVPSLAPDSFFDIEYDVARADLPPPPATILPGGGPAAPGVTGLADNPNCPPDDHWDGNVDVEWTQGGVPAQVNVHYGTLMACPGAGASYIHVPLLGCTDDNGLPAGVTWQIGNLCPGWSATLVNEDTTTAAPATLPPGWTGWICVTADASVAVGTECCPTVTFDCNGEPAVVTLCATACDWDPQAPTPVVTIPDWTTDPATGTVHFTLHFENRDPASSSHPVTGSISSQQFGVFQPDFGPIGSFNVPSLAPDSFFDIEYDVARADLPPQPQTILPGGGPAAPGVGNAAGANQDCTPDDHWDGNVDVVWGIPGTAGAQVNVHYGTLLACPGGGASYIHIPALQCNSQLPITWQVGNLCQGFTGTLVNEDLSPAPANLPANWTGYICITADATVPSGIQCCPTVTFTCDNQPAEITLCTSTCLWATTGTPPGDFNSNFAVRARTNPILGSTTFGYVVPEAGTAEMDVFDMTGRLVRTLYSGPVEAGTGTIAWDGRGASGRSLPAGVYLVRLRLNGKSVTQKVQLLK